MARRLQDQTIKDNFLFAAIMMDGDNCKNVLELILGFEIDRVEVSYEKSIVYHPEYKGIRLDVYAKSDSGTCFNVEMQVSSMNLQKRARYYHDQIDMDLLHTGVGYEKLPDSYVIFICDYDPIGLGKYKYTKCSSFLEDLSYNYVDGTHTYFLSTVGKNDSDEPEALVSFLKYIGEGTDDGSNELIDKLKSSEKKIKADRAMGERFMLFEEMMEEKYKAGYASGHSEGLEQGRIQERIDVISKLLAKGKSEADAKELLDATDEEITRAREQILETV